MRMATALTSFHFKWNLLLREDGAKFASFKNCPAHITNESIEKRRRVLYRYQVMMRARLNHQFHRKQLAPLVVE